MGQVNFINTYAVLGQDRVDAIRAEFPKNPTKSDTTKLGRKMATEAVKKLYSEGKPLREISEYLGLTEGVVRFIVKQP